MPVFSPAGGSLSWFTNGTPSQHGEQRRKAPGGAVHFFLPGTTPASLRAQCRRDQQWAALLSLGHQLIHEMMQRMFMPEGRRRACGVMANSVDTESSRMEHNSKSKISHAAECGWCSLCSHFRLGA